MGKPALTQSEVAARLATRGYILISEYKNAATKITALCSYCHKGKITAYLHSFMTTVQSQPSCGCQCCWSEEQIKEEFEKRNLKLMSPFITVNDKVKVECGLCPEHTIFETRPAAVLANKTKSCGCLQKVAAVKLCKSRIGPRGPNMKRHLSKDEVEKRLNELGFKLISPYENVRTPIQVLCKCGKKTFWATAGRFLNPNESIPNCGCDKVWQFRTEEEIREIFASKGFKLLSPYIETHQKVNVECHCPEKTHFEVMPYQILSGQTTSCGCNQRKAAKKAARKRRGILTGIRQKLEGKKFGKITFIRPTGRKNEMGHYLWEVTCECEPDKVILRASHNIINGHINGCGCGLYVNGIRTSYKALELHDMLGPGRGIHNFDTKECGNIDIALVLNGKKIAIEYDEWTWHASRIEEDSIKNDKLINNGWKVLRVKASGNLPQQKVFLDSLEKLSTTEQDLLIIELEGWGQDTSSYLDKATGKIMIKGQLIE